MRSVIPRLITFDVTGTLLKTKVEQHYAAAAATQGLSGLDGPRMLRAFKASFKRLGLEHPIYGKHSGLGWENWWRALVHEVICDQDASVPKDKLDRIADSLIECYSTNRCWHKYPGTEELLRNLSGRRDVVLGVISNFDERMESVLASTRIRPYFAFVLTSYGLGVEKPDPGIFQEALRLSSAGLAKAIEPQEAIHIGDRVDNDYMGARAANWRAILLRRNQVPLGEDLVDPRDVFGSFVDLKAHLDGVLTSEAARYS